MSSNISIILDDQLSEQQRAHFFAFEEKCFGKDLKKHRKLLYFSQPFAHIVLKNDKELISYLRIFIRQVTWQDKKFLLGGIGSVATDQGHRGKGVATTLLKKAMEILGKEKVDFALLQTYIPKGGKLYSRVGFYPVNKGYTFLDANDELHIVKAKDVMVAPVGKSKVLGEILASKEPLHIGKGDW
jgi:predicted GNAT family N-acyltransferase